MGLTGKLEQITVIARQASTSHMMPEMGTPILTEAT